ncbi:MAG: hypothetical protein ROO71_01465 [Balneola sp.]
MKTSPFNFFLLFIFLFVFSCNSNQVTYKGKKFEIDYNRIEHISNGDWIQIDEQKFVHLRSMQEANKTPFSLPTTEILVDSLETGRTFKDQIISNSIALHLARYLDVINTNKLSENEDWPKYTLDAIPKMSIMGILTFSKADSSTFIIKTSKDYPAPIRILE